MRIDRIFSNDCAIRSSNPRRIGGRSRSGCWGTFEAACSGSRTCSELRSANPPGSYQGVIFSNELLDAMPLRVYRWNAGEAFWVEWGVTFNGEQFCWAPMEQSLAPFSLGSSADDGLNVTKLSACLPDGFAVEISVAAVQWWRDAAKCLDQGWLLTIDYGLKVEELFSPSRVQGTLRAYRQHRLVQDVLVDPGDQDITAQVNFSSLQAAGAEEGLQGSGIHLSGEVPDRSRLDSLERISRPVGCQVHPAISDSNASGTPRKNFPGHGSIPRSQGLIPPADRLINWAS